jgi:hypothetical protein
MKTLFACIPIGKNTKKLQNIKMCDGSTFIYLKLYLAKHGGSCYKVFKETATAFEWVFNADNVGNQIVGQHKSAIGICIPFKDVIWKT